jgi:hypothetical protein
MSAHQEPSNSPTDSAGRELAPVTLLAVFKDVEFIAENIYSWHESGCQSDYGGHCTCKGGEVNAAFGRVQSALHKATANVPANKTKPKH